MNERIYLIGGANVDIIGSSFQPLRKYDSNPGIIKTSFGGVARNIAENLSRLNTSVGFCSVFGEDDNGKLLRKALGELNIDISKAKIMKECNTSTYIAILDELNDMHIAMSDMRILDNLDEDTIMNFLKDVKEDNYIVVDTNLKEETIRFILSNTKGKIALDPISTIKASKVKNLLNYFTVFKPNKYEAATLSGIEINDKISMIKNLDYFLAQGVKEIIISLSSDGVIFANKDGKYHITHEVVEIENTTGGGDSFLAGYLAKRNEGLDMIESCKFAAATAVCTIMSKETVNPSLDVDYVNNMLHTMKFKVEQL